MQYSQAISKCPIKLCLQKNTVRTDCKKNVLSELKPHIHRFAPREFSKMANLFLPPGKLCYVMSY